MNKLLAIIGLTIFLLSCNKDRKISNSIDGETWVVTEIIVGNLSQSDLPSLQFDECKIYKETCNASWALGLTAANFAWQFREKGNLFEISNQSVLTEDREPAIIQCTNFSGVYEVLEKDKSNMKISSTSTVGYSDTEVLLTLELK